MEDSGENGKVYIRALRRGKIRFKTFKMRRTIRESVSRVELFCLARFLTDRSTYRPCNQIKTTFRRRIRFRAHGFDFEL